MTRAKSSFRFTALAAAAFLLTACETMDSSVAGIKSSFGNIVTASSNLFSSEDSHTVTDPGVPSETLLAADENCPPVSVVEELGSIHRFSDMDSPSESSNVSNIEITDVISGCRYNENNIMVDIALTFEGTAGAEARIRDTDKPSFSYPYFVAVTSPNGNIMAKEVYALTVAYDSDQDKAHHEDRIRQIIPLDTDIYGPDHSLLVGFQLNEQELAYNRGLVKPNKELDRAFAMSLSPQMIEPAAGEEALAAPVDITGNHAADNETDDGTYGGTSPDDMPEISEVVVIPE